MATHRSRKSISSSKICRFSVFNPLYDRSLKMKEQIRNQIANIIPPTMELRYPVKGGLGYIMQLIYGKCSLERTNQTYYVIMDLMLPLELYFIGKYFVTIHLQPRYCVETIKHANLHVQNQITSKGSVQKKVETTTE